MLNPKQEREDNYFMVMFSAAIFSALCLFAIFNHGDTGLKYTVLKNFGTQTRGIVASIEPDFPSDIEEHYSVLLKNSKYARGYKLVNVSFSPIGGVNEMIRIPVPEDDQTFSLNQFISVLYLDSNPKIAHPEQAIEHFSFDAALLKYTALALVLSLTIGFIAFRRWQKFKAGMRRY